MVEFREVILDNRCVTQVLHGDANSAEVSYTTPANFSMKDISASGDEFEVMEFSSLKSESSYKKHEATTRDAKKSQKSNKDNLLNRSARYQGDGLT